MVRAVVQRVRAARVTVAGQEIAAIGPGLCILLGIGRDDTAESLARLADRLIVLRIFEDPAGKMNLSAADVRAAMLVVSQFTLWADLSRGRRPSFIAAAPPQQAEPLYEYFVRRLQETDFVVETGRFGAHMLVSIENDGPVTLALDTADW